MTNQHQALGLQEMGKGAASYRLSRREGGPTVVSVTSGKGGVGKTQVAANLAVSLARDDYTVLLLDADLGLASLDLALGLSPKHNMISVLRGDMTLEEVMVEGPFGLKLVPACPGRYESANLDVRKREALLDTVEEAGKRFDIILIDTGAGIGSNAVGFAAYADEVLLVTTPDPTALRDAYAMAKILHRRASVDRIHVVANQVRREQQGVEIHARMQAIVRRFLRLELTYLGSIPFDEAVPEAVAKGEPYVLRSPRGDAALATANLIRRLDLKKASEKALSC